MQAVNVKSFGNPLTLVFLITDQVPNNHPGHQISGFSGATALLIIYSCRE